MAPGNRARRLAPRNGPRSTASSFQASAGAVLGCTVMSLSFSEGCSRHCSPPRQRQGMQSSLHLGEQCVAPNDGDCQAHHSEHAQLSSSTHINQLPEPCQLPMRSQRLHGNTNTSSSSADSDLTLTRPRRALHCTTLPKQAQPDLLPQSCPPAQNKQLSYPERRGESARQARSRTFLQQVAAGEKQICLRRGAGSRLLVGMGVSRAASPRWAAKLQDHMRGACMGSGFRV